VRGKSQQRQLAPETVSGRKRISKG